jgi:hypothetical protein
LVKALEEGLRRVARSSGCSNEVALQLLIDAIQAALGWARQIDERSRIGAQVRACAKVAKAFARIANCTKRASARVRDLVDTSVVELFRQQPVDSEMIESLLDAMDMIFASNVDEEIARTALSVSLGVGMTAKFAGSR